MMMRRRLLALIGLILIVGLSWLATTDHDRIWPFRNYVYYQLQSRWWRLVGEPQSGPAGSLAGTIRDQTGQPVADAWVALARWDGTLYTARSDAGGGYRLDGVPAGRYLPVVSAPGYVDTVLDNGGRRLNVRAGEITTLDAVLRPETPRRFAPGQDLTLGEATTISCTSPLEAAAVRREVAFDSGGRPNQPALFYTPTEAQPDDRYPLLLIIYPGPVDTWECASVPLAAAGYAVLGTGPVYTLDLEPDVDELERILDFAADGLFPQTTPAQAAILGGSYSGLHVQLLLQRGRDDIRAAILLGAPTDIFAMRRHLEEGTFIPPFGLDKVLVSMGLPDRVPLRYWYYSGAYHVRRTMPPTLVIHSRDDKVVPIDQSELLVTQLSAAGVPHEVYYFDKASHYLLSPLGESRAIYDLALEFLEEHLGP